jgi:hypothetical protein
LPEKNQMFILAPMLNKSIFIILFSFLLTGVQAQKKNIPGMTDCKLVHDKKANRDYFIRTDTYADEPTGFDSREFILANFRLPEKKYNKKDRIYFAYIVEKDGSVSFLKLLSLTGDKEIENEAKRIMNLMPKHLAARCAKEYVASMKEISFPVDWQNKN